MLFPIDKHIIRRKRVRIGIVSDTHAHLDSRIAAVVKGCDVAIHAGDIGGANVLDALQPRFKKVIAVVGNNDNPAKWKHGEKQILTSLPKIAELKLPNGSIVIEHGDRLEHRRPYAIALRNSYPHARVVIFGHTHKQLCDTSEEPWILNPGASGRMRTFGGPACLILSATESRWDVELMKFNLQ